MIQSIPREEKESSSIQHYISPIEEEKYERSWLDHLGNMQKADKFLSP